MIKTILISKPTIQISHLKSNDAEISKKLCINFTAMSFTNFNSDGYGSNLLLDNKFDIIEFKNIVNDWYDSVDHDDLIKIRDYISSLNYQDISMYGGSMGGFAAIAFSKYFSPKRILVFSPQISIKREFDNRWIAYTPDNFTFKYESNNDSIFQECKYYIAYDPMSKDSLHANYLKNILSNSNNFIPLKFNYSGHLTINFLAQLGELSSFVVSILSNDHVNNINLSNKRSTQEYWVGLSTALFERDKFNLAARVLLHAVGLFEDNLYLKKQLIFKLREYSEKINFKNYINEINILYNNFIAHH